MDKVILTPLKRIRHPKGDVFHGMKKSDDGYAGFGEAYFSTVNKDDIKGWKKHTLMTLNLVVPVGAIKFVVYDEADKSFFTQTLSPENYQRLTVKPGAWVAFKGVGEYNMLLNLANLEHDPDEAVNIALEEIDYAW
ncbi:MAG: dTDP-4-dehydrorhamnose 3,5-epimerase [Sulfurospirillum sp.]|nr:MAG: dTDP-4-dehydrorhamnose 3,5-epimerase [Sulfurospirillum sp.]